MRHPPIIASAPLWKAWRPWLFCSLLLTLEMMPAPIHAEQTTIATTILGAWKDRENQVLTLDCAWSAEEIYGAGIASYSDEGKIVTFPPKDLTAHLEDRFRIQGHRKMRYEYMGPQPIRDTHTFEMRQYVSLTDGEEQICFYGKDETSAVPRFPPRGYINPEPALPESGTLHLWPLLLLYRPSMQQVAQHFDLTKFSPKGTIIVAGRECLLLDRLHGGLMRTELAIDMRHDCIPVRFRQLIREESTDADTWSPAALIDIDYAKDAKGKWSLKGWKSAILGPRGVVREQMTATVKNLQINRSVPDSLFHLDFPVGTDVADWKHKEFYILREGGQKRYISEAEGNAQVPFQRLWATESGEAVKTNRRPWFMVFLVLGGLVLLTRIVRFSWKRWKNPSKL